MQWWNAVVDWASSEQGWRVLSGAVLPFVAVLVAGIVAALIARSAIRRLLARHEREQRAAAVAGLVRAARRAAVWSSLGAEERTYVDHLAQEAEVQVRLLPTAGAASAASWAEHELDDLKRHSVSFSFQAEQFLAEFRDRLLQWHARPSRAKKLFSYDLDRWSHERSDDGRRADDDRTPAPEAPLRPASSLPASRPVPASPEGPARPAVVPAPRAGGSETPAWDVPTRAVDVTEPNDDDVDSARLGSPVSASTVRRRTVPEPDEH